MAGHSKWANIRFRKNAQDQKRGKLFTGLIREIVVATKTQGSDPQKNPRLRQAISKALAGNMSKDVIERAIKKGSGSESGENLEEILYEGYSVGGAAVIVRTLTDNRNRTASEIRHLFSKYNGNLGASGSVLYQFDHLGWLQFAPETEEEQLLEFALNYDAQDIDKDEQGFWDVYCAPDHFHSFQQHLHDKGLNACEAKLIFRPNINCDIKADTADQVLDLLERLDQQDDSQEVFCNAVFE